MEKDSSLEEGTDEEELCDYYDENLCLAQCSTSTEETVKYLSQYVYDHDYEEFGEFTQFLNKKDLESLYTIFFFLWESAFNRLPNNTPNRLEMDSLEQGMRTYKSQITRKVNRLEKEIVNLKKQLG